MGDIKGETVSDLKFIPVENPSVLKPILKARHPNSCFFHNQVVSRLNGNFEDILSFYSVGREINENTWFMSDYIRKDFGHNYSISAPSGFIQGTVPVPKEIKQCFISGGVIEWDGGVVFTALEKPISAMIFDISANMHGNITEVHPCMLYYMEIPDALNLPLNWGSEAEVRRLNPDDTEFIMSTWKYCKESSRGVIREAISSNASAGVFVNGKCESGVFTPGNGLICALYTMKEYRGCGYGKLTMHYTYKETAKDGCVPCSTVEVRNSRSMIFHDKLGAKKLGVVDWIDLKKLEID